jgi:hypothetical protein
VLTLDVLPAIGMRCSVPDNHAVDLEQVTGLPDG